MAKKSVRNPNRIDGAKMEDAIFRPKDNLKQKAVVETMDAQYFSDKGVSVSENAPNIVAKKTATPDKPAKYFALTGPNGKLYNPIGMYDANTLNRKINSKPMWSLRSVPRKAFELYVKFLQTKNKALLTHAEREII